MNNDNRIIDKICNCLLPLAFLFLVVICIIIFFTIPVHAATSNNLPYYVDYYRGSYFNNNPENNLYYNVNLICDMRWCGEPYQYNNTYRVALYYVNFNSNSYDLKNHGLNTVIDYSLFNFSYDYVIFYNVNYLLFELGSDGNFHQVGANMSDGVSSSVAILGKGSGNKNSFGWSANVPHALRSGVALYYNGDTSKAVFINGTPDISVGHGHALPPDNFDNPDYTNNHVPPHNVPPHYTINNYIWNTPPTTDFSTIENGLNSLGDLIKWLSNNISGEFSNLIDNLKGLFEYIGDTLNYYGDLIIKNIQNGINTFYYNMKALIEPIVDAFNYITEPLDLGRVEDSLSDSTTYALVSVGSNFKNTFQDYFDNITVPNTLSFSIPYTILTKSGYINFDFGWYANIRSTVLPWIVGFLYAGFGLAIFRSVPSIIHGLSGVLQKGG